MYVCALRLYVNDNGRTHRVGSEAAAWCWHSVVVVWLFVFIFIGDLLNEKHNTYTLYNEQLSIP